MIKSLHFCKADIIIVKFNSRFQVKEWVRSNQFNWLIIAHSIAMYYKHEQP